MSPVNSSEPGVDLSFITTSIHLLDDLNQSLLLSIIHSFENYKPKIIQSLLFPLSKLSHKKSAVTLNLRIQPKNKKLEVLFMKRVERNGDVWSGHVCFPGGKFEENVDNNLYDTAVRETCEEIGVNLRGDNFDVKYIGRVDDHLAQGNLPVSCFVFLWNYYTVTDDSQVISNVKYNINPTEVGGLRWVPLELFISNPNNQQRVKTIQVDEFGNKTITNSLSFHMGLVFPRLKRVLGDHMIKKLVVNFPCIEIPLNPHDTEHISDLQKPQLKFVLWGLTLRILSNFLRIVHESLPLLNYDYDMENRVVDFLTQYSNRFARNYLTQYEEPNDSTSGHSFKNSNHTTELLNRISKL
ncbi:hypothetical protein C9374_007704 [Naegleria lovaniensis]|uniref:Nudix hydrolase domain-containing protein n=1 Tax=Naegleria lovaniensis TaxID=51637 RepID=A0AA88GL00_NAELO|nr:uncharacterized protein C9374_007704 [Naegleria lovaniensis]KAG2379066.1 hypothetical protein C9374_007704 [Naegleria lovaniensis]